MNDSIELKLVTEDETECLHRLQVEAFMPLYEKYQDDDTSPAKESHFIKQMPEPRINTGFRHFCPIFGQPSLSSKGKILYLTYFLFQGILGLPSRSWLALSFFSLISRYSSIFKAFSMVLSKRKRPHRMVFPFYKVLLFLNFFLT